MYDNEVLPSSYKLYCNDRINDYGGLLLGINVYIKTTCIIKLLIWQLNIITPLFIVLAISTCQTSGPDKIPPKLLKLLADEVSPRLQLLFSASLHQGIVPVDWKKAIVCPIFKKGDRKNPSNYRPVSLTSICSKLMEHVIYSNIMSHLHTYNILSPDQFGFRKDHSDELQLIQTVHDLAISLNDRSNEM